MFKIYDGREHFYQWDLDRQLIISDPEVKQVHFCNRTDNCSLVCETYVEDGITLVNVPNILLQTDWKIRAYAYDGKHTKHEKCYEVKSRTKPADYAYTETEILNYEIMGAKIDATNKELSKKANSADVYNRNYVDAMLKTKANKSDVVNAYCFKGSIDTVAEMPFKWDFIPNGVPTMDGEPCGTYDEETNTVTVDEEYYYGEVIFPIKPIILKETSSYYFCDNLTPGIGYVGDHLFHIYDCADAYGASYQTLTKGTVIDKVIVEECWGSQTNYLGTLYKGYKTWYDGDDWDDDGILDDEYPFIPFGAFANGAVYNVIENEVNYAWTGEGWDALGGNHIDTEAREEIENLKITTANVLRGSASGEAVGITDIAPNEHIIDVKLSSKNLFKSTNYTKGTLSATDGTITSNATVKAYCLTTDYIYLKSGAYILSNIDGANLRFIAFYDLNKGFKSATWTNRAKTFNFTITEDCYVRIDIERDATVAIDNFDTFCDEYQFMLEEGTKATAYTPYIDDVSQATLSALGRNLINADDLCGKQFTKNDDGSYTFTMGNGNNRFTSMANIFIPKGSKIVFSITGFESDNVAVVGIQTLYANGTYLSSYDVKPGYLSNRVIKTEDDIVGLRLYLNQGITEGATVKLTGIQLEIGTTPTPYEPYKEPTSYKPMADGTVEGVVSIYPNTTLIPNKQGVLVEAEYNRDLNKAFAELQQAIISLGGNI